MKQYIGVKMINAQPMTRASYNALRGWVVPADENPNDEGFLVEYVDGGKANHQDFKGYISWSPKEVFENAYKSTECMTFGFALEALKAGHKVARKGWNGKGLCLQYVPAKLDQLPYIEIRYPETPASETALINHLSKRVPWLASQTDMLAGDWYIAEVMPLCSKTTEFHPV